MTPSALTPGLTPRLPHALTYEEARALAADPAAEVRRALAARADAPPEILYFLCDDVDGAVRRAVAENPAAPAKADLVLADDTDEATRLALAAKVAGRQRDGHTTGGARARSITGKVLDRLSRDRMALVRSAIAEGLKDLPGADPEVVHRLARDLEILVAAPLLEFSPLLGDSDLLEIIRANPIAGALAAIARRAFVGRDVTEAIVASRNSKAITHLLYNSRAQLQEHTLDSLIDMAETEQDWHQPLIHRPELGGDSARRLAELVADHVLERLMERGDLPAATAAQVRDVVRGRLANGVPEARALPVAWAAETEKQFAPFLAAARERHARGVLTETELVVALLTDRTDDLVASLAVLGGLAVPTVLDMVASQSPRALAALANAAGLSAPFALELQIKLGRIAKDQALKPHPDGSYAISDGEMRWQIEMFAEDGDVATR